MVNATQKVTLGKDLVVRFRGLGEVGDHAAALEYSDIVKCFLDDYAPAVAEAVCAEVVVEGANVRILYADGETPLQYALETYIDLHPEVEVVNEL